MFCFHRFFRQIHYSYSLALEDQKLHTSPVPKRRLDALFLIQVSLGFEFSPVLKIFFIIIIIIITILLSS
jgi:hypothetical protein